MGLIRQLPKIPTTIRVLRSTGRFIRPLPPTAVDYVTLGRGRSSATRAIDRALGSNHPYSQLARISSQAERNKFWRETYGPDRALYHPYLRYKKANDYTRTFAKIQPGTFTGSLKRRYAALRERSRALADAVADKFRGRRTVGRVLTSPRTGSDLISENVTPLRSSQVFGRGSVGARNLITTERMVGDMSTIPRLSRTRSRLNVIPQNGAMPRAVSRLSIDLPNLERRAQAVQAAARDVFPETRTTARASGRRARTKPRRLRLKNFTRPVRRVRKFLARPFRRLGRWLNAEDVTDVAAPLLAVAASNNGNR